MHGKRRILTRIFGKIPDIYGIWDIGRLETAAAPCGRRSGEEDQRRGVSSVFPQKPSRPCGRELRRGARTAILKRIA